MARTTEKIFMRSYIQQWVECGSNTTRRRNLNDRNTPGKAMEKWLHVFLSRTQSIIICANSRSAWGFLLSHPIGEYPTLVPILYMGTESHRPTSYPHADKLPLNLWDMLGKSPVMVSSRAAVQFPRAGMYKYKLKECDWNISMDQSSPLSFCTVASGGYLYMGELFSSTKYS